MKDNRKPVGFCAYCKKEVYSLVRVGDEFICYDCVGKLSQENVELKKQNEELESQLKYAYKWENHYTKKCDELIVIINDKDKELADLKANGIFPRFKIGQIAFYFNIINDIKCDLITDITIEENNDLIYRFKKGIASICVNEEYVFATQAEAEQSLAEMRNEKE